MSKLKLHGFNNLTKTLSFNLYDVCYTATPSARQDYFDQINQTYHADFLTNILTDVTTMIGANILNIAAQDYEPQGASVTILVSEEPLATKTTNTVVGHLDKSHITIHTYPESHPEIEVSTFRADIEVSTCGLISPLKALNYLINAFDPDIATIDYRVRGFTRDIDGNKLFMEHPMQSIQHYMLAEHHKLYYMEDINVSRTHTFHTKMMHESMDLRRYMYQTPLQAYSAVQLDEIKHKLRQEMDSIFKGPAIQTTMNENVMMA